MQRWSRTSYSMLVPGYRKAQLWNQASAGMFHHYLSVKTARRARWKYLVCVMRSREKKWSGCNMLGITTKPATWMDRNLAGKMNGSWEIAHNLERRKWVFWRIGTGLKAYSQQPKDTTKIACAIQNLGCSYLFPCVVKSVRKMPW